LNTRQAHLSRVVPTFVVVFEFNVNASFIEFFDALPFIPSFLFLCMGFPSSRRVHPPRVSLDILPNLVYTHLFYLLRFAYTCLRIWDPLGTSQLTLHVWLRCGRPTSPQPPPIARRRAPCFSNIVSLYISPSLVHPPSF